MDNLTHTLVGAVTAQAFLKRKVGPEAVPVMCWASNLPDIDALTMPFGGPAGITLRRTFGHSVFLYPVWCALLAWLFKRLYPKQRYLPLFLMCLLAASLHVFFDLVNSFGVVALWPFSDYRPELAVVFIVDLFLLALLAAPFLAVRLPRWKGKLRRACKASAAAVCAYVLLCAGMRVQAEVLLERQTKAKPDFSYVFPEPLGPHRWRGVLRFGNEYRVYLIHVLSGRVELKQVARTDEDLAPAAAVRRSSLVARRLDSFFKAPVWEVAPLGGGVADVRVWDLRFKSVVLRRGRPFEFRFLVLPGGSVRELGRAS